tara:strand:+ start:2906 stop:3115 length:210 start_codon:yes stop_codon:yes gene_type:complete
MAQDEFNKGATHGFKRALFAVRVVDKSLEFPHHKKKEDCVKYDAQKDILYKIYEEIKYEMTKEVHENDY